MTKIMPTGDEVTGPVEKLATGISGFEYVSMGGLPRGRTTLVSGNAGCGKTVFAAQFLAEGIRLGQPGVFVTFEESPADIRRNMANFGWDIPTWEAEQRWSFVDASPDPGNQDIVAGDYQLDALLARIEHAVKRSGARRLALDSLGAIFARFAETGIVRREMFRIVASLKALGVTSIITAERTAEYGEVARYGVEEFVVDNVIILRNAIEAEKRRRMLEVLKFRGTTHRKGEVPFTIRPEQGIVIIPLSAIALEHESTNKRVTSGNATLDEMCGGGFFRDSIVLVSGATGSGKTLIASSFLAGGFNAGERCLLFAFEESRGQLFRNAASWGMDFAGMEREGRLKVVSAYPESESLEDHLIRMKGEIEGFRPDRIAVDSLSALERGSSERSFREFVIAMTSFIKHAGVSCVYTTTTTELVGGASVSDSNVSTITDAVILLRYVETDSELGRALAVLKMRGSAHDKSIRSYAIDDAGMQIGPPFHRVTGIISGAAPGSRSSSKIPRSAGHKTDHA